MTVRHQRRVHRQRRSRAVHRQLAQHGRVLHADAALRRRHPAGVDQGRGEEVGVDPSECYAEQHTGQSTQTADHRPLDYSRLAARREESAGSRQYDELDSTRSRSPEQWRYIGKEKMRETFDDAADMVTGKAVIRRRHRHARHAHGDDRALPGRQRHGQVLRRRRGAESAGRRERDEGLPIRQSAVAAAASGTAFMPHDGVAVLAENTWAAWQGRRALRPTIEWDLAARRARTTDYDTDVFRKELEAVEATRPGQAVRYKGDVDTAFARRQPATSVRPLLRAASRPDADGAARGPAALQERGVRDLDADAGSGAHAALPRLYMLAGPDVIKQLLWTVEELYQWSRRASARIRTRTTNARQASRRQRREDDGDAQRLKKDVRDKVTVHVTLLGGGFGRKSKPDYAIEAAFLARQYPGTPDPRAVDARGRHPVQLLQRRREPLLQGRARRRQAVPRHLLERSAFTSFFATLFPIPSERHSGRPQRALHRGTRGIPQRRQISVRLRHRAVPGSRGHAVRHRRTSASRTARPRTTSAVGWMRSVANIYHAFGTCSFADELAIKAGAIRRTTCWI